jgi:hypothetical protein
MTHSLHRQGTAENLKGDYVVLAMSAKGINEEGAAGKLQEFLRIASRLSPVNTGDMKTVHAFRMSLEEMLHGCKNTSIVHAVFTEIDTVRQLLGDLQETDLGISVVVSGLLEPVRDCCHEIGLEDAPHTVNHSLGVWGRTEILPEPEVLQISTMCGHGMVSFGLIKDVVAEIRAGQLSVSEASERLARPCECGIFNPRRAAELLEQMAAEDRS